jgi:hypothetical protein
VEVKVFASEAEALREISMIENLMREPMTAADECTCQHRDKNGPGTGLKRGQLG